MLPEKASQRHRSSVNNLFMYDHALVFITYLEFQSIFKGWGKVYWLEIFCSFATILIFRFMVFELLWRCPFGVIFRISSESFLAFTLRRQLINVALKIDLMARLCMLKTCHIRSQTKIFPQRHGVWKLSFWANLLRFRLILSWHIPATVVDRHKGNELGMKLLLPAFCCFKSKHVQAGDGPYNPWLSIKTGSTFFCSS